MENTFFKKLFMASVSIFFLVLAVCVIINQFSTPWYKNIQAQFSSQPYSRSITVTAEGKVNARPDIAIINLSVVTQGKTVKEVTQNGNNKMASVIAAVKKLGIEAKDITSTQYNLYPEYFYPENRKPELSGYNLSQDIRVKVRDLDKVEDVLDQGVTAGANQIGQLSFDIDDPARIKKAARELAFATAKEKAIEMSASAGVKLGSVVTFSEGYLSEPPVYANFTNDAMRSAETVGTGIDIEPGSADIRVSISVTYEIE